MTKKYIEPIKRFHIEATLYETEPATHFCNSAKTWSKYLSASFFNAFTGTGFRYERQISNASFRLVGLELKVGLLLADDEFRLINKALLRDFQRPSIVMDSVLATYSILEGITMLSYIRNLPDVQKNKEVLSKARGDKIAKGIRCETGKKVESEVKKLRKLRDRCVHQDHADQIGDFDYEVTFGVKELRPHIGLLHNYLTALSSGDNVMPDTNLDEFWNFTDVSK